MSTPFQDLILDGPCLTDEGWGMDYKQETIPQSIERRRLLKERLLAREEHFNLVQKWVHDNLKPIATINKKHTSYGLKHIVERYLGYTSQGELIAAMILEDYETKPASQTALYFNVSGKELRRLDKEFNKKRV